MTGRERGLALVTVLFLLALLLVLAVVLGDRVLRVSRDTTGNGAREQALQAATAAIEWVRQPLAVTYRDSHAWHDYLTASGYSYPAVAAFRLPLDGITVDLYLRDNPDGDDDPHHDNDLRLFVLARARTVTGTEAAVESLCRFDPAAVDGYRQGGGSALRTAGLATDGPADVDNVNGFELAE